MAQVYHSTSDAAEVAFQFKWQSCAEVYTDQLLPKDPRALQDSSTIQIPEQLDHTTKAYKKSEIKSEIHLCHL